MTKALYQGNVKVICMIKNVYIMVANGVHHECDAALHVTTYVSHAAMGNGHGNKGVSLESS